MTFEEKRRHSEEQFRVHSSNTQPVSETTPTTITTQIGMLCARLGASSPCSIPVIDDHFGLYGWCSDGVREKVRNHGGSIRFGWTIWEWPSVMLTAEFHAVWVGEDDRLFDITPKPQGEPAIVFAVDCSFGEDFDFNLRPRNSRMSIYKVADRDAEIDTRLAALKSSQRQYEERRASRAGMSIRSWMASKLPDDKVPMLIDRFIETCNRYEEKLDSFGPSNGYIEADDEFIALARQKDRDIIRLRTALS